MDSMPEAERSLWHELALGSSTGTTRILGCVEQFAGFHRLESLIIADIVAPRRPITADLFSGRERVRGAQVMKQADVLMLHHLVPDEMASARSHRTFVLRTAHRARQLALARDSCCTVRSGRPLRPPVDALHMACGRRRRSDRYDRRRGAPRDVGQCVAGTRVRVRRRTSFGQQSRPRSTAARRVGCARGQPQVSRLSGESAIQQDSIGIDADPAVPVSVRGWLGRRFERRGQEWKEVGQ